MTLTPILLELEKHRQQFPALRQKAYFNYGGQGPMPQSAIDAIMHGHQLLQEIGPFSDEANRWLMQEGQKMRETIAVELGVSIATVALTEDVTVGCNIALWGVDWQAGDHLLLSDCEHPGVIAAAQEIRRRFGVEITTCPLRSTLNEGDPVATLAAHLKPTTRMVAISHILWNTGQVLPLKEIASVCHSYPTKGEPIYLLVDAAQSVGMLPLNLDALDVDFYAFTGHKWWCGAAGIGGLYVRSPVLETFSPTFIGWRGITKDAKGNPTGWQPDGRRFEIATSDYTLFAGLRQAIATHRTWGTTEARYQRILHLSRILWQKLNNIPWIRCLRTSPPESGLVSFQVMGQEDNVHGRLVQFLEKRGFLLRTILDPDCVRACVHYLTLESEIDRLIETIEKFQ